MANAVQITHQKLPAQLQQIQTMIQTMHIKYADAPQPTHQDYGGRGYYVGKKNYQGQGGHEAQR